MGISNQNALTGLRALSDQEGSLHTAIRYGYLPKTNTTDLYVGMLVKLTGKGSYPWPINSSDQTGSTEQAEPYHAQEGNYPEIAYHPPRDEADVWGVVMGFDYDADLNKNGTKYTPAGVARLVMVNISPDTLYECPASIPLNAEDAGLNVDMTLGTPVPAFGLSGQKLDSASKAVKATLPLRLEYAKRSPGNDITKNDAIWIVRVNTSSKYTRLGMA